jgi:hypothetical protein
MSERMIGDILLWIFDAKKMVLPKTAEGTNIF